MESFNTSILNPFPVNGSVVNNEFTVSPLLFSIFANPLINSVGLFLSSIDSFSSVSSISVKVSMLSFVVILLTDETLLFVSFTTFMWFPFLSNSGW